MSTESMDLERAGDAWSIRFDEQYATDPADLWSALTTPERLARWMTEYRGDLRLGGTWEALSDGEVWGTGRITECDPPHGFTTTWIAEGEGPTTLRVRLEPVEGGTRLILEHEGVVSPDYGAGWAAYLGMLADHLRDPQRDGLGEAGFQPRFQALKPEYAPRFEALPLASIR